MDLMELQAKRVAELAVVDQGMHREATSCVIDVDQRRTGAAAAAA